MPFQSIAVATYTAVAEAVALYSVIEIGPNLLAAITSIIGAIVLIAQLRLGRRVVEVRDTADQAKDKVDQIEEVVELRKKDDGPQARRRND
jgi:hypothetical protein